MNWMRDVPSLAAFAVSALIAAATTTVAAPASACTTGPSGWSATSPEPLLTPPEGPLILDFSGGEGAEELHREGLEIVVTAGGGDAVAGTWQISGEGEERRIVWTPDVALDPSVHRVVVRRLDGPQEDVLLDAELLVARAPDVPASEWFEVAGAREVEFRSGPEICCEFEECLSDDCGNETCSICWKRDVRSYIELVGQMERADSNPTGWTRTRFWAHSEMGRVSIASPAAYKFSGTPPFCIESEVVDEVRELTSERVTSCFQDSEAVEPLPAREHPSRECPPDSTIVGEAPDPLDDRPGCNTAAGWAPQLFLLILAAAFRRRFGRFAPTDRERRAPESDG